MNPRWVVTPVVSRKEYRQADMSSRSVKIMHRSIEKKGEWVRSKGNVCYYDDKSDSIRKDIEMLKMRGNDPQEVHLEPVDCGCQCDAWK